ncbi:hypothetical protein B0H14DRAFT_1682359 [Mycena olivaceomarginata]|nr:hypothetical protein B0H14DRAFT_1682359 [Mycena olivaceomarginata]
MSEIICDTFIALHSSDVLQKLEAEFRKRYKGFKIPLLHLRAGKLAKKLAAAGSRIKVMPAQARSCRASRSCSRSRRTRCSPRSLRPRGRGRTQRSMGFSGSSTGNSPFPRFHPAPSRKEIAVVQPCLIDSDGFLFGGAYGRIPRDDDDEDVGVLRL